MIPDIADEKRGGAVLRILVGLTIAITTACTVARAAEGAAGAAGATNESIELPATAASVHGKHMDVGHGGNVEKWEAKGESVEWPLTVPKDGWYGIDINLACEKGCGGTYDVVAAGQTLAARVEPTRGWRDYRTDRVGVLHLPAGKTTLVLTATQVRVALMNVKFVRLTPGVAPAPPVTPAPPVAPPPPAAPPRTAPARPVAPPAQPAAPAVASAPAAPVLHPNRPAPQFSNTAGQFAKEFLTDEDGAWARYKGAVIELRGIAGRAAINSVAKPRIYLVDALQSNGVDCFTLDPHPWASVAKGQQVTIRGVLPAKKPIDAELIDCEILSVGPPTAVPLTAEKLARAYESSHADANEQYDQKPVRVTGEVERKAAPGPGRELSVSLKGTDFFRVDCRFADFLDYHSKATAGLKPGDKVTIAGEYAQVLQGDTHAVILSGCHLIPPGAGGPAAAPGAGPGAPSPAALAGTWNAVSGTVTQTLALGADGSYSMAMKMPNFQHTLSGTWKLEGSKLVQKVTKSDNPDLVGGEHTLIVREATADRLVLVDPDKGGEDHPLTLARVPGSNSDKEGPKGATGQKGATGGNSPVPAADLAAEFARDEAAASARYEGKTLTVTGNIADTHTTPNAQGFLYLSVTLAGPASGDGGGYTVKCNLPSNLKGKVETLKKGDAVTIAGKYSRVSRGEKQVELNLCSFAK